MAEAAAKEEETKSAREASQDSKRERERFARGNLPGEGSTTWTREQAAGKAGRFLVDKESNGVTVWAGRRRGTTSKGPSVSWPPPAIAVVIVRLPV